MEQHPFVFSHPFIFEIAKADKPDIWIEVVKNGPGLLWVIFAFTLLFRLWKPLIDLIPKLDGFEYGGLKLKFLSDAIDGVVRLAMAEKDRKWNVKMPQKDKDRALKRALDSRKLLSGARILWVDDQPENDNNERRMLQQLGVYCDFAQSTKSAMECLEEHDYDCVISDMVRKAESDTAGTDLIRRFRESKINLPVILYIGTYDSTLGKPDGAFGITNRPDELLHLLIDVLGRRKA